MTTKLLRLIDVDVFLILCMKCNKDNMTIISYNKLILYSNMLNITVKEFKDSIDILSRINYILIIEEDTCIINPYKYNRTSTELLYKSKQLWDKY